MAIINIVFKSALIALWW